MIEQFKEFLKDNNCFKEFIDALNNQGEYSSLTELHCYEEPDDYLQCLDWENTPQGEDFWRELHFKWTADVYNSDYFEEEYYDESEFDMDPD